MNDGALTITLSFAGALMLIVGLRTGRECGQFRTGDHRGYGRHTPRRGHPGCPRAVSVMSTYPRSR